MMPGDQIFRRSDIADNITFLLKGEIELFSSFEGNEFIMETVATGGVLHWQSFLLEDFVHLDARCVNEGCLIY